MPVKPKESQGQVLRGFCPVENCGASTKRKDPTGTWVSKCAHPGKHYEGRLVPGGKKTTPVIPENLDRGLLPEDVDPRHGPLTPLEPDPGPAGLIDAAAPRDGDPGAVRVPQGPYRRAAPTGKARNPLEVSAHDELQAIANAARTMAGALAGAQRQVREYEGAIARASVEIAKLRDELEDAHNEIGRLEADLAATRITYGPGPDDEPDGEDPELGGAEQPFDPDEIPF